MVRAPCPDYDLWTPPIITPGGVFQLMRYVGWAHPRSQKGDMICILEGCTVPVVLRVRVEGDFFLVGDGYVHGIMDGQEMERDGGVDWIEIKIY
jgi:hypothetical protein